MSRRFIGIDLEGTEVRVAALTVTAGKIAVELEKRSYDTPATAAAAITEILGGKIGLGDRLVTALPCRVGLFRRLHFPFREKNKIAAALPLELNAQLPIPLAEHVIAFLPARPRENDYEVDAVVVNKHEVEELLTCFPEPEHNPRRIDLFPFAFHPLLPQQNCIQIYCRQLEVVVSLVCAGRIEDYRLLPGTGELDEQEIFDFIASQISQIENSLGENDLPLWVIGAGVTDELLVQLYKTDRTFLSPAEDILQRPIDCEMAPAVLLALGEMGEAKRGGQLNFRQGEFSPRGQLKRFRSKLVAVTLLLFLVVVGGGLTMQLGYLQKTTELQQLKQQLKAVFYQVMPDKTTIVDIPLQLEQQLQTLQKQVHLFGLGGHGAAAVLQGLSSSISRDIRIDVKELGYNQSGVRLSGNTDSFEAVDLIVEQLKANYLFDSVTVVGAQLAPDGNRVDFKLQLKFSAREGA